jgi:hypothetical protein
MDGLQSVFVEDYMLATGVGAIGRMAGRAAFSRLAAREASAIAEEAPLVLARRLGREGEAAAGIKHNTRRIDSITGSKPFRVPDGLTGTTLSEVKNVASLSFTKQIQDSLYYALTRNLEFELFVRESTKLAKPLRDVIDAGFITLKTLTPRI